MKGRDRSGTKQRWTKLQADPFLEGREMISRHSTEPPNPLCCHQVPVKFLGKACAPHCPPAVCSWSEGLLLPLVTRLLNRGRLQWQHYSPAAPGRTEGTLLQSSFASHCHVFLGIKAFLFLSLLRNKNQLRRSKKITSLTCINKHMAFNLMITVYFSYFINSLLCICTIIIDYLDYHSLVHYFFKA